MGPSVEKSGLIQWLPFRFLGLQASERLARLGLWLSFNRAKGFDGFGDGFIWVASSWLKALLFKPTLEGFARRPVKVIVGGSE